MSFGIAHWCVLVASFLPILCAGIAKFGLFSKSRRDGGFDNNAPRDWLAQQKDWRGRANAAQANGFESLPFFIGAVALALQLGADPQRVGWLAAAFVLLRLVYIALYLADKATARSVVWALGLGVNVAILFAGYR